LLVPFNLPQGSTFERTAGNENPNDPKSVFKDLDLDMSFHLPKDLHERWVHAHTHTCMHAHTHAHVHAFTHTWPSARLRTCMGGGWGEG